MNKSVLEPRLKLGSEGLGSLKLESCQLSLIALSLLFTCSCTLSKRESSPKEDAKDSLFAPALSVCMQSQAKNADAGMASVIPMLSAAPSKSTGKDKKKLCSTTTIHPFVEALYHEHMLFLPVPPDSFAHYVSEDLIVTVCLFLF